MNNKSTPIVTVHTGKIKGKCALDFNGNQYFSFQGIPYAKPPIGNLRFKAPQPPECWSDIRDATKHGSQCRNRDLLTLLRAGSEDCLFANIYTPRLPDDNTTNDKLLPVTFWLHGGAFYTGNGNSEIYGPGCLVAEDVVLVTINYRLGPLGFLKFDNPELQVPGNAGLKDMLMALRWVQKNISAFCGDPNNVTIFGESAGGAAVHFLMLTPLSDGLFHKAISQSSLSNYLTIMDYVTPKTLARKLGFSDGTDAEVLQFLRSVSVEDLIDANDQCLDFERSRKGDFVMFGPVVEPRSNYEESIITMHPSDIISSGKYHKVPYIAGFCKDDGMIMIAKHVPSDYEVVPDFTNSELLVPYWLGVERGTSVSKELGERIKKFYYGESVPSKRNVQPLIDFMTDTHFLFHIVRLLQLHIKNDPTHPIYLYRFRVDAGLNMFKRMFGIQHPGTSHVDDVPYLFTNFETPKKLLPGTVEYNTVHRMVKMWTNFAKTGNPNPPTKSDPLINVEWKRLTASNFNCLDIGKNLRFVELPENDRMVFWKNLIIDLQTIGVADSSKLDFFNTF